MESINNQFGALSTVFFLPSHCALGILQLRNKGSHAERGQSRLGENPRYKKLSAGFLQRKSNTDKDKAHTLISNCMGTTALSWAEAEALAGLTPATAVSTARKSKFRKSPSPWIWFSFFKEQKQSGGWKAKVAESSTLALHSVICDEPRWKKEGH